MTRVRRLPRVGERYRVAGQLVTVLAIEGMAGGRHAGLYARVRPVGRELTRAELRGELVSLQDLERLH